MKYNLKNNLLIWSIILATTLLFMIFFIDIRLATFIQNNIDSTSLLYKIFSIITLFGSFKYIVLINIVIFSYLLFMFKTHKNDKNYKGRFYIMIYGICGEILSVIATQLLKFIFGRSRPFNFFALNDGNMFTFFNFQYEYVSFPSLFLHHSKQALASFEAGSNDLNDSILLFFRHLVIRRQTDTTSEDISTNINNRSFDISIRPTS